MLCISKEKKLKHEKEKFQDTVQTYESICQEKFDQAKNILDLYKQYEILKRKNTKCRAECIKQCQRALKLSIERAGEQQSHGCEQLSKDEQMIEAAKEEERAAAKAELLNIHHLLSKSRSHLSLAPDDFTDTDATSSTTPKKTVALPSPSDDDYAAMWQSSSVQFPQLTGTIRAAVLRDDKHKHSHSFKKKKNLLLPKGVSASMTNHI